MCTWIWPKEYFGPKWTCLRDSTNSQCMKYNVKYIVFNIVVGKYEFLVMPMALQNAPCNFMRPMNHIFEGLMWDPNLKQDYGIIVYLDDILIYCQILDQHMEILKLVLERLRKNRLHCRFDTCTFAVTEVEYLGFRLSHQ
jgi:hypothetical protein